MKTYQPKRSYHSRRLPHLQVADGVYFITFRLKGSLPQSVVDRLRKEKEYEENKLHQLNLIEEEIKLKVKNIRSLYFGKFDALLDKNDKGPHFLKEPDVAKIVQDAILHFDGVRYKVICFIIMSNHVHLVFYKLQKELGEILGSVNNHHQRWWL